MKIKILSFLYLFIMPMYAASSIRDNVELKKSEWLQCKQQLSGYIFGCNEQIKAYHKAIDEFTENLNIITEQGINASHKLYKDKKSFFLWTILFGLSKNKKEELRKQKLIAYGTDGIREHLQGRNNGYFESSNDTLDKFCEKAIENFLNNYCSESSYASDKMGPLHDMTDEEQTATKTTLLEIIKAELDKKSNLK